MSFKVNSSNYSDIIPSDRDEDVFLLHGDSKNKPEFDENLYLYYSQPNTYDINNTEISTEIVVKTSNFKFLVSYYSPVSHQNAIISTSLYQNPLKKTAFLFSSLYTPGIGIIEKTTCSLSFKNKSDYPVSPLFHIISHTYTYNDKTTTSLIVEQYYNSFFTTLKHCFVPYISIQIKEIDSNNITINHIDESSHLRIYEFFAWLWNSLISLFTCNSDQK